MAKPPIPVNRSALVDSIESVESNGPKENRTELYEAVAKFYNKHNPSETPITHSVAMLRIKEWGIKVVTPAGKRGRGKMSAEQKEAMAAGRGNRRGRKEKFADNPDIVESHAQLKQETPERFLPVVEKIVGGSMSAAVKLHCLECSGYVTAEVRNCVCTSCPLYAFRPYQGKVEQDEDSNNEQEVEAEAA